MKEKCEYCNRKATYKISSFHSGCIKLDKQEDYLPIPGNVEMNISYKCGHCLGYPKQSYKTDYCYVFIEKINNYGSTFSF